MNKLTLFTIVMLFSSSWWVRSNAQTVLDDYVKQGLENNLALKQEAFKLKQSLEALKEAKGLFLPDFSFNSSYTFATGGRTIDVPVGDLLNPVYTTLNQLTDSQNFPTDLSNASEPILPNKFHDTRIELRQPLLNTDIYYNYKAKSMLVSVQQAQIDTYKKELIKEIKKGYYRYLQSVEVLHIYDSTETVLQELIKVNESLVRNYKATKDVLYSAQFELSDLYEKRAEAERQRHLAQSYFNFLLNRDLDLNILEDSSITFYQGAVGSIPKMQEQAILGRQELEQLRKVKEANQYIYKLNQGSKLPRLSMGGSLGYQGFGYRFDNNQDYGLLQFNLQIPIFNGFQNNAKIQNAKIEIQKTETRYEELQKQIRVQVIDAVRNLQAARSTVLARQSAAMNAQEAFKITKRKYEENQVILVEYLDSRTKFTNSQIGLVIANYSLLIREAELQRILSL